LIRFKDQRVLLINTFDPRGAHNHPPSIWFTSYSSQTKWIKFKPLEQNVWIPEEFVLMQQPKDFQLAVANEFGQSCTQVCQDKFRKTCVKDRLPLVNSCARMQQQFPCKNCDVNVGLDQPCFVNPKLVGKNIHAGKCLLNTGEFSCEGTHPSTRRLCACAL
jgi:hypothetical protein